MFFLFKKTNIILYKLKLKKVIYIYLLFYLVCINKLNKTIPTSKKSKNFILITSLYNECNQNRLYEYLTCLEKNLSNEQIKEIHVFYDTTKDIESKNFILLEKLKKNKSIKITYGKKRPTFDLLFTLSNKIYPCENIIISNADIYFDSTLNLLSNYDLENKFLWLTRWNVLANKKVEKDLHYCADTWIFKTPIKKIDTIGLELGTWHCDSRIIIEASKASLIVSNPSLDIKCFHLHLSNIRHYNEFHSATYPLAYMHSSKLINDQGKLCYF